MFLVAAALPRAVRIAGAAVGAEQMELKWSSKALSDLARLHEFLAAGCGAHGAAAHGSTDHAADQPTHRRTAGRVRAA